MSGPSSLLYQPAQADILRCMMMEELIRSEFPLDDKLIYLNHAAVAPWPRRTADAVKQFAEENIRFGASHYPEWVEKEAHLREQIKRLINAPSSDDIALLKNTSEALSVVAFGLDWKSGENVVSSDQEFPSNRIPWQAQADKGVEYRAVDIQDTVDPEAALMAACDSNTRVLAISSVQYGSGIRINLERLGKFTRKQGILFCVDAIQSIGAHSFDVQAMNADFAMADAHKWILGPEGIALFYCADQIREKLKLHEYGWHMVKDAGDYDKKSWEIAPSSRRFECGSANMLGIHALSASLSLFEELGMKRIEDRITEQSAQLMDELAKHARIELVTPRDKGRYAGIVTFRIAQADSQALHHQLLSQQVICAQRFGGIRFSPHFYTGQEKIKKALEILYSTI
jgi:cysteine desulfurase/selenocysteine lyase